MKKLLLITLFILSICTIASADPRWKEIDINNDTVLGKNSEYVDMQTLKFPTGPDNPYIECWVKITFFNANISAVTHTWINPENGDFYQRESFEYDRGIVTNSYDMSSQGWHVAIPNSVAEFYIKKIISMKP